MMTSQKQSFEQIFWFPVIFRSTAVNELLSIQFYLIRYPFGCVEIQNLTKFEIISVLFVKSCLCFTHKIDRIFRCIHNCSLTHTNNLTRLTDPFRPFQRAVVSCSSCSHHLDDTMIHTILGGSGLFFKSFHYTISQGILKLTSSLV